MKIKTYYINLNKDKKRNEEIINELNKTNLNYERFSGIDGSTIDKMIGCASLSRTLAR